MRDKVEPFDQDAKDNAGYVYTTGKRLSSSLATANHEALVLSMVNFAGRAVLDAGCGDGHFTLRYFDQGKPSKMVGLDAAGKAIKVANEQRGGRLIHYLAGDIHKMPFDDNSFDLVLIQGVLHHDDEPWLVIKEAFRVAPEVAIMEPNGNNFALKIIEKLSSYHRSHQEKSYAPRRVKRWVEQAGGQVVASRFAGFVPMFCPDWLARTAKAVEPIVERLAPVNALGCAVHMIVARREAE